jgi:hypothetical protein
MQVMKLSILAPIQNDAVVGCRTCLLGTSSGLAGELSDCPNHQVSSRGHLTCVIYILLMTYVIVLKL